MPENKLGGHSQDKGDVVSIDFAGFWNKLKGKVIIVGLSIFLA